jgi:hypothetical protein
MTAKARVPVSSAQDTAESTLANIALPPLLSLFDNISQSLKLLIKE